MRNEARGRFASASTRSTRATVARRYACDAPTLSETPSARRAAVSTIFGRTAITSSAGGGASGASLKPRNANSGYSTLRSLPASASRNARRNAAVERAGDPIDLPSFATSDGSPVPIYARTRPGASSHSDASSIASSPGWRLAGDRPTSPISSRSVSRR